MRLNLKPRRTDIAWSRVRTREPVPPREQRRRCDVGRLWTYLWIAFSALLGGLAMLVGLSRGAGLADDTVAIALGVLLLGSAAGLLLRARVGLYLALTASAVLVLAGALLALVAPSISPIWVVVGIAGFLWFQYFSARSECFR